MLPCPTAPDRRAPDSSLKFLARTRDTLAPLCEGEVPSYIPELAKADPDQFGIALATIDGHVYETGDTQVPFTIQSISKAVVFASSRSTPWGRRRWRRY